MKKIFIVIIILVLIIAGYFGSKKLFIPKYPTINMEISSSAFYPNQKIPERYTCDGEDINPYLKISNIPENAKSLVLIVDDPDAPLKTWTHWIIFNIPVLGTELEIQEASVPEGALLGKNDFNRLEYGGPCPPSGTHRYFFKIFALDTVLDLEEGASRRQIEKAMQWHVIDSAELIGVYSRKS